MKKLVSIVAAIMMLTTSVCAQGISLKINDKIIESEIKPVQEEGTTLVPLRIVGEYLGAQIEWSQETQTATIVKDGKIIELIIGSKIVKVNGVEQSLQCAPKLINGTTMVPIRLVSENLGSTVVWEEETGTVVIESKKTNEENTVTTQEETNIATINYTNGTYIGEFILINEEAIPQGKGVFSTFDKSVIKEGTYENGKLIIGKVIFSNGFVLEGYFGEELKLYEGTITYFFKNQNLKAILPVKDGMTGDANIYNLEEELLDTMTAEEFLKWIGYI